MAITKPYSKWLGNVPDFIKNRQDTTRWINTEPSQSHLVDTGGGKSQSYKTENSTPKSEYISTKVDGGSNLPDQNKPYTDTTIGNVTVRKAKPQLTREVNLRAKKSQTNSGITPNSGG